MARPRPKPSDDEMFWYGIALSRETSRYLFDVLAVVMRELQNKDRGRLPASFLQYREMVNRHMKAVAKEFNAKARFTKIDHRLMQGKLDSFLGLEEDRVP